MLCDFGERVTNHFDELNNAIYECEWYTFAIKFQNFLPMILMCTQEPMVLKGFGNVPCTREAFKKVRLEFLFNKL